LNIHLEPSELKTAERVGYRIGSKWSAVEVDDLTSHLYLWLVQNTAAVARWRSEPAGEGKLYVSLRREAARYCAREQAARVGQPISKVDFYTTERVKRALPFIFEATPETVVAENPVTGEAQHVPHEHGVAQTIIADLRGTFHGLNREVQQVLAWRFRDGLSFEEIGELKNITKDGAKKQIDRAVQRLVDSLEGTL
jgi:DNA-directed RNA polymerase specialized sigma24 family protein